MEIPWAGERVWLHGACDPKGRREGGTEASTEHKDIALAFRALLFCPFPPGEGPHCGSPQGPGSYSWSHPVPGGAGLLSGLLRQRDGSLVTAAMAGPPCHYPAWAALCTEELLCFSADVGQPGTEIFNMPAITGAGNSPHTCTSFPTGLTAMQSRRLGRSKHLLCSLFP